MSELQPGMLALIIGTTGYRPETVGMIVEIISVTSEAASWMNGEEMLKTAKIHLLPIKPEADPLDQKQQQELHA